MPAGADCMVQEEVETAVEMISEQIANSAPSMVQQPV